MARIISFEKFTALSKAGIDARAMHESEAAPQIHSTGEEFLQIVARRMVPGTKKGW